MIRWEVSSSYSFDSSENYLERRMDVLVFREWFKNHYSKVISKKYFEDWLDDVEGKSVW